MSKEELQKIWDQLDQACEAVEKLDERGIRNELLDFSALVSLKNQVETLIETASES